MRMAGSWCRFFVLAAVVPITIAACDLLAGLTNPLIGTWSQTDPGSGAELTIEFKADGAFIIAQKYGGVTQSVEGTYVQDASAKRVTLTVTGSGSSSSITLLYEIGNSGTSLTLTPEAGGSPLVLTRQG